MGKQSVANTHRLDNKKTGELPLGKTPPRTKNACGDPVGNKSGEKQQDVWNTNGLEPHRVQLEKYKKQNRWGANIKVVGGVKEGRKGYNGEWYRGLF